MFRVFIKFLFILSLLLSGADVYSQWIKIIGFNFDDRPTAMATDISGNVYVTGYATSGTGNVDILTVKYSPLGEQLWAKTHNGPGNGEDRAFGIVVDNSGNILVTGYSTGQGTQSDYTTIKYRPSDGEQLWIHSYNTPVNGEDRAFGIVVDRINNVYITGYITQFGSGTDIYTMKLKGTDGQPVWGHVLDNFNINSLDRAFGIVVDSIGANIYLCGYLQDDTTGFDFTVASYDSTGNFRWVNRYNGPANNTDRAFGIVIDSDENIYATGVSTFDTLSGTDYTTIRYNSEGDTSWVARYNGSGNGVDRAFGIVVDSDGNSFVTGYSTRTGSGADYLTIKYDSNGDSAWVRPFNGVGNHSDTAYGIYLSKNSTHLFVTGGASSDTGAGKLDAVTIKYDATTGQPLETETYIGTGEKNDAGIIVTADTSKNLFVAGYTESAAEGYNWYTRRYEQGFLIKVNIISTGVPKSFRLYQNYPNPFNPTTTIKFDVTKAALVKLRIFDILGREVAVLVNENLRVGSYEAEFSSTKLASGLYFYELKAEDYREVKKMILVK